MELKSKEFQQSGTFSDNVLKVPLTSPQQPHFYVLVLLKFLELLGSAKPDELIFGGIEREVI